MALAEKRICEHTDATTISSADEFIVDSMANGTRNITMTNLENQILSTDTYSALSGIGDGTITGSIADIDSNLNNLTYDSTTNRLTMTGNTAFSGTIDSSPTAGSGNAVSSGGTKTYVDSAVSELNAEISAITDGQYNVWFPDLYDFTTKIKTLTVSDCTTYVKKIGDMTIAYVYFGNGSALGSFNTMMQLRNFPNGCNWCLGGSVFNSTFESAQRSIQASNVGVYFRPNITGSLSSGVFSMVLFFA